MDFRLDDKFFRRAKKLNRAVEITDNHAFIPAVRDSPEIRVPLPNRRPKTMEERQTDLDAIMEQIGGLDEEIEVQRKQLIELAKRYSSLKSGAAEVVVQNLKIQALMEKRKALQYPERFISELEGITLKDIFQSKRDTRKLSGGGRVFQINHRVEPITSLYVDLEPTSGATGTSGATSTLVDEDEDVEFAPTVQPTLKVKTLKEQAEKAKVGAMVQQKKAIKLKKTLATPQGTPAAALGGGSAGSN